MLAMKIMFAQVVLQGITLGQIINVYLLILSAKSILAMEHVPLAIQAIKSKMETVS